MPWSLFGARWLVGKGVVEKSCRQTDFIKAFSVIFALQLEP